MKSSALPPAVSTESTPVLYLWVVAGDGTRTLLNQQLLAEGMAQVDPLPSEARFSAWLTATEQTAQAAEVGLWAGCPEDEPDAETSDDESDSESAVDAGGDFDRGVPGDLVDMLAQLEAFPDFLINVGGRLLDRLEGADQLVGGIGGDGEDGGAGAVAVGELALVDR